MNAEELQNAVDELEQKLERLRVLFEQYFQGIEKIPPSIPQKDVDRRIWVLRRERIRNTGTRFKFQQIIQRYNTLGSYWMRITREIENGTYKRDVLRAKKRFGDPTKPKEVAKREEIVAPPEEEFDGNDLLEDDDFGDLGPAPVAAPKAPPPRPPPMAARAAMPAAVEPPAAAAPSAPARPAAPAAAAAAASSAAAAPTATGAPPAAAARVVPRSSVPARPSTIHPSVPKILAKKVETDDDLDDMLNEALGPAARPAPKPTPAVAKPAPAAVAPAAPPPAAARPPAAAEPMPAPPIQQRPAPAIRPQATNPALKPQSTNPGDAEFRRVYSAYVDAKRKNGESTAGVTYENLAKSLQETRKKLADRAGGKAIDFEVTVKDGKTILKPVVR